MPRDPIVRIRAVDAYVSNTKAQIINGGDMACFRPATDTISMPDDFAFFDTNTGTRTENYSVSEQKWEPVLG